MAGFSFLLSFDIGGVGSVELERGFAGAVTVRMNCFDRRTLMVLSLTLSSGFSKSSAIVRPAEPALSWITLRLESFASYIHASYAWSGE